MPYEIPNFTHFPHVIPDATDSSDGLMSAADKTKLDSLTPGGGPSISQQDLAGDYFSANANNTLLLQQNIVLAAAGKIFITAGGNPRCQVNPTFVVFQLQVDGGVVQSITVFLDATQTQNVFPLFFSRLVSGLAAGAHTVEIWGQVFDATPGALAIFAADVFGIQTMIFP